MKAYSLDLRQKIVDAYAEGNISQRQLAKQFRVALSFIEKLLKQHRETGSIAPLVRLQQTPTKLNAQQLTVLKQLVEANNDATLDELRYQLEQKTGFQKIYVNMGCVSLVNSVAPQIICVGIALPIFTQVSRSAC